MAANPSSKKSNSTLYKSCPSAILKVVPNDCSKIKFSDLRPYEDYQHKAIIGKINHLYPLGKRKDGYIRKIIITDALDDSEVNEKLSVFLFDQYAKDSESSEVEGFIIMLNFIVEHVTKQKAGELPVHVLAKNDDAQIWFGRKVNKPAKKKCEQSGTSKKVATNKPAKKNCEPSRQQKQQRVSDEDDPHALSNHHYEYTKLGDLVESETKESCNIYGIVDKCDLKITQGKKLKILDLLLSDQTETGFSCSVFAAAGETFPDIYPGDIVRLHRMQVYKFRGKLKGRCPDSKFILVFSKNNEGDKPRTVAKTFTFTPEDITRFKELFEWSKTKSDPKLIREIKKDDFVNIICQVIGVYVARTTDAVILKIWDGTKTDQFPGVHWGMKDEKLDQKLFTIARNYYVVLSVYGHHTAVAAELEPGQYIEVSDAHLYSPRENPEDLKLCLHAGNKEGRGINVLNENEEKLKMLKDRLEKVISDTLEFGNQTDDLLSQNNSLFLNCDISLYNSEKTVNGEASANRISNGDSVPLADEEAPENEANRISNGDSVPLADEEAPENEGVSMVDEPLPNNSDSHQNADINLLNEPLAQNNVPFENTVISELNASIQPGQSTQGFGLGMLRDENSHSKVTAESDPICNLTPLQTRYFFHDSQRSSNEMTDSIFPSYKNAKKDEWWNSVSTVSVTDQHSDIKPSSLAEVVQHSVPHKFRTLAAVFCFKPNTNSIQKFIHLCCPKCLYISEDAYPSLEPYETRDGLSFYFCPVCSSEEVDQDQWPVLEYSFVLSLSLHDGSGPPYVEVYLWKENAIKFFKNITPEEALRDSATADSILHMLWSICPNCRPFNFTINEHSSVYPILDCCILSYHSKSNGNDVVFQIFDTILI